MSFDGFEEAEQVTGVGPDTPEPGHASGGRTGLVILWSVVGLITLGVLFVATALYTDRSEFCQSCHEMKPYFAAWEQGPHSDVPCIGCHVAPGYTARFEHKFVALGEVRAHFAGDTSFPRTKRPDVPDARCTRCHRSMPVITKTGFPHGAHVKKGTCAGCHPDAGHDVTIAALQAAGIYSPAAIATIPAGAVAAVGAGVANVPGHVAVRCTTCHDLAKTGCARCHTPKHKLRGDCLRCHRAGAEWAFIHPKSGVDCVSCHNKRPAGHTDDGDCLTCHDKPGVTWMYTHVAGQKCETCHARPNAHRAGACGNCHKQAGKSWAFSHPNRTSNCPSCHKPPANHYSGSCVRCHKRVGVSFAFSHPSAGEHSWRSRPCAKCHPSGGSAVYCTCHNGRPPSD